MTIPGVLAVITGLERGEHLPYADSQRRNPLRCVYRYQFTAVRGGHREDQPARDDQAQERGKGCTRVRVLPGSPPDGDGEDHDEGCCTGHGVIVRASQDQINPRAAWRGQNGNERP